MDLDLKNILVIDIETVACAEDYDNMDDRLRKQWDRKSVYLHNPDTLSSSVDEVQRQPVIR